MLEAATEDGRPFHILFFKNIDYVVNIMELRENLDDMEGANTKRNYKGRNGQSLVTIFTYQQPFGLHFCYHNQVNDHNNRHQYPIYLESKWATKFCLYCKFAWYISVMELNTALASRHFQNDEDFNPSLSFRRKLAIYCTEKNIGTYPGDIGRHIRACRRPKIFEIHMEDLPS